MGPDSVRQAVLAAITRGLIPLGGPSELAARGLVEEAPAAYWHSWSCEAVERIRARPIYCSCIDNGEPDGGRCSRCHGPMRPPRKTVR